MNKVRFGSSLWILAILLIIPTLCLFFFFVLRPARRMDAKRMPHQSIVQKENLNSVTEHIPPVADCISQIDLYGEMAGKSSPSEGILNIEIEEKTAWGYMSLIFKKRLNLWEDSLVFYAQGAKGNEILSIGFTDAARRTSADDELLVIPLTSEPQKITIKARDVKSIGLDKSTIASISFFILKSSDKRREPGLISIKDIEIIPNRRP